MFNGTSPNGTWRLFPADDRSGLAGEILGWSLRITTTSPAPGGTTTPGDGTPTTPAPGGTGDTVGPRVTGTAPTAATAGVPRGATVKARLNESARRSTVTGSTAYLVRAGSTRHVAAAVRWRPDTQRIVINPERDLRADTRYRVVITTAVRDVAGNRLDQSSTRAGLQPKTWRFTTR